MVTLTIDQMKVTVPEGTTIMEAAASIHIDIPKLCYLKGINEISACRVCVVEMEGKDKLITSCNNVVEEGMVIYTNSPKVRLNRRKTVSMLLSQHDGQCITCSRTAASKRSQMILTYWRTHLKKNSYIKNGIRHFL